MPHARWFRWLALPVATLALAASPGPEEAWVEVKNPSLEEVEPGKPLPAGWVRLGEGIMTTDHHVARTGGRSVKVILRGLPEAAALVTQTPCSVPVGKQVRIRAYVRTHDLQGEVYMQVYRYPAPFDRDFRSTLKLSGTRDWTVIETVVPAKRDGENFQVRLWTSGTLGRVWWDDLSAEVEDLP